jgi:hypothetical protein
MTRVWSRLIDFEDHTILTAVDLKEVLAQEIGNVVERRFNRGEIKDRQLTHQGSMTACFPRLRWC